MALRGVSGLVKAGTTLGIVGESGSGKSTLAHALVSLVPLSGGRIFLDGDDVSDPELRERRSFRQQVQLVFQDPSSSLNPRMTVGRMLEEAVRFTRPEVEKAQRLEVIQQALRDVQMSKTSLHKFPHEFSGGQQQRLAIARSLVVEPRLLILDEVTSALDVVVQAEVMKLLESIQQRRDLAYIFISHDVAVVNRMSHNVAVMYLGQIVETGPSEAVIQLPVHPYTDTLLRSVPQFGVPPSPVNDVKEASDLAHVPEGCSFHPRCPVGPRANPDRDICCRSDPQAVADEHPHRAACHFAESFMARTSQADGPIVPDNAHQ